MSADKNRLVSIRRRLKAAERRAKSYEPPYHARTYDMSWAFSDIQYLVDKISSLQTSPLYVEVVPRLGIASKNDDISSFAHGYDEAMRQVRCVLNDNSDERRRP